MIRRDNSGEEGLNSGESSAEVPLGSGSGELLV